MSVGGGGGRRRCMHACVCKGTLIFVSDFVTLLFI